MNRWLFLLRRLGRKLWLRASAYALLGIAAALTAAVAGRWAPPDFAERFGGESVESVLTILASSMLAVATFSLGAMVTAYTAVSQAASPRVAELVTGDDSTQKSLATFVGAFLFAIVGVTALNAHYYGQGGRAIVFAATLAVVALVAYRLLAWVSRLSSLARLGHMIELVEDQTRQAMQLRLKAPCLGGRSGHVEAGVEVLSAESGYVQNVDGDHLQGEADDLDCDIEILAPPGTLVMRGQPIARMSRPVRDDGGVRAAFAIGAARSFEQDPRFGLIVLGEIAGKALSPGVNDPGTAIQVMATGMRLLEEWSQGGDEADQKVHPRLRAQPIPVADLLDDVFGPCVRYGMGDAAVTTRLRKTLTLLAGLTGEVGEAAKDMRRALPPAPR